jgi:hypothetical protein
MFDFYTGEVRLWKDDTLILCTGIKLRDFNFKNGDIVYWEFSQGSNQWPSDSKELNSVVKSRGAIVT